MPHPLCMINTMVPMAMCVLVPMAMSVIVLMVMCVMFLSRLFAMVSVAMYLGRINNLGCDQKIISIKKPSYGSRRRDVANQLFSNNQTVLLQQFQGILSSLTQMPQQPSPCLSFVCTPQLSYLVNRQAVMEWLCEYYKIIRDFVRILVKVRLQESNCVIYEAGT